MTPEDLDKLEALAANPDAEFITASGTDFRELIRLARRADQVDVNRLAIAMRIVIGYPPNDGGWSKHTATEIAAEYAKLRETPR